MAVLAGSEVLRYEIFHFEKDSWAATAPNIASLRDVTQNLGLEFNGIKLADDDLEKLRGWPNIVHVAFSGCTVPEKGFWHLATLPNLDSLSLKSGNATDDALAEFGGHPKLRTLYLSGRSFSDGIVEHIGKIKGLAYVSIFAHRLTKDGAAELEKMRPAIEFSISAPSFDVPKWRLDKSKKFAYSIPRDWSASPIGPSPHDVILVPSRDRRRRNIIITDQPGNGSLKELKTKYERDLDRVLKDFKLESSEILVSEDRPDILKIVHTNSMPGVLVRQLNYIVQIGEQRFFVACTTMVGDGKKYDEEFDLFVKGMSAPPE